MDRISCTLPNMNTVVFHKYPSTELIANPSILYNSIAFYAKQAQLGSMFQGGIPFDFDVLVGTALPIQYTSEDLTYAIQSCTDTTKNQIFYAFIAYDKPKTSCTRAEYQHYIENAIKVYEDAGFINLAPMHDDWYTWAYIPLMYVNPASKLLVKIEVCQELCTRAKNSGIWDLGKASHIDQWNDIFIKE